MKTLARLIGLLFIGLGIAGLVDPGVLINIGRHGATPVGLWIVALTRVAIGAVLYTAARAARTPTALRVLGALFIVSGVITPFFGVEQARAVVDAVLAGGSQPLRLWSVLIAGLGAFIAYTVSDGRRVAYRPASSTH
jgi:hypothetical protein